jgi:signal recognition particle subunit SRP54
MGDIQTLLEKAQEAAGENAEEAEDLAKKIMTGRFSLVEMRQQMEMLSGMGPLSKVLDMIPGFGSARAKMQNAQMEETQRKFEQFKVIMGSMTRYEMENPGEIKSSRIRRIATGAGVEPKQVKELLTYYESSKRMMRGMAGNKKMQRKLMAQLKMDGVEL